jgi:hypothetical protein
MVVMDFDQFILETCIVITLEKEGLNFPELKQTEADWSEAKSIEEMINELGL